MGSKLNYQKKRNNRRIYSNLKVVGYLKKLKANTIIIYDDQSKNSFRISKQELKKAFVGDKVQCSLTPKGWAKIEKVIERNTNQFIGTISKHGKNFKAFPLDSGEYCSVLITGNVPKKLKQNDLVKVKVILQPNKAHQPKGIIEFKIDESNVESMANELAISKFSLRTNWSKGVINDIRKLTRQKEKNKNNLKSLINFPFVTIDGKNAKDFDDAVFAEKDNKGRITLYVAIADVARFVKTGSFLDEEARKRGTSTYFTNRVIPMLPEEISNGLCSLKPNEERICLICKIQFDKEYIPYKTVFFEGVIKSTARLTYEETNKYFETENYPNNTESSLRCLAELYKFLERKKIERYALDLNITDFIPQIVNGKLKKFISSERNLAHKIIEECMLLTNINASQILLKSKLSSIYRIHPKPDYQKIKQLEAFVRSRKINVKIRPEGRVEDFFKLSQLALGRKDKEIIHMQILQSLNLANYSEKPSEHFALAYGVYTHFTSPIRRYPDLMVHRALKELLRQSPNKEIIVQETKKAKLNKINYPFTSEYMNNISRESSSRERLSEEATRDAKKTMKCELALEKINQVFKGYISGITNFGIFIHLTDLGIEGLCHIKRLPGNEYYLFNENSKSLVGKNSGNSYFLGNTISAKIKSVDIISHRIDLEIKK